MNWCNLVIERMRLMTLLALVCAVAAFIMLSPANALADGTKSPELTPVTENGTTLGYDGSATFDAGSIDISQSVISHVFTIRNVSTSTLEIDRLVPSCGCTSAVLQGLSDPGLPYKLDPGTTVDVKVDINVHLLESGPFLKSLSVYLSGDEGPSAILEITGSLIPPIQAVPSYIDLGSFETGKSVTRMLTIGVSRKLASSTAFHLVSTDPDIRITDVPEADIAPYALTSGQQISPLKSAGNESILRSYLISFSRPDRIGLINAWLYVAPNDKVNNSSDYTMTKVRVTGDALGPMSSDQPSVVFGTTTFGNESLQRIQIVCPNEAYRQGLHVSGSKYVSARFEGADHHINDGTGNISQVSSTLVIDLSAGVPLGNFTGTILVSSARGQTLILPVSAYIMAGQ